MKVLKFGGTSVGTPESIKKVAAIIKKSSENDQLIVVVSAFSQVTNKLENICGLAKAGDQSYKDHLRSIALSHIAFCNSLIPSENIDHLSKEIKLLEEVCQGVYLLKEITKKSKDYILSAGERLSSFIIAKYLSSFLPTQLLDSRNIIVLDQSLGDKIIDRELCKKGVDAVQLTKINVFPGYIASTSTGTTTTLGRGGSDYTAALLASFFKAKALEIWSDVNGMLTADPNLVKQAKVIKSLSYEEAMELSHFGAKVIYPPSIQPVLDGDIPVFIKNTFAPNEQGTRISSLENGDYRVVRGISSIKDVVLINISGPGMVGVPSYSLRFFHALSTAKVNIILITQSSSEHSICAAISKSEVLMAKNILQKEFGFEIKAHKINEIEIENDLAILAVVGSKMKNQVGISGQMFYTLGKNGISVKAIAQGSSERNISTVIPQKDLKKALNSLHESFFLSSNKRINLYIVGTGNVGKAFLGILQKQYQFLLERHQTKIVVVGIANSRKMYFDDRGIPYHEWEELLHAGDRFDACSYLANMEKLNIRNSIFVDITASEDISALYKRVLDNSISVVTPNKYAATAPFHNYKSLLDTASKKNCSFLFETNVCAGLPVISTLSDLIKSGDRIHRIQAVLSGTLNYLFNTYTGNESFLHIIKKAKSLGLTEPDPRLDLFGEDVRRKILILARESGHQMELSDVKLHSFLPGSCNGTSSVEEFYSVIASEENHFLDLIEEAKNKGEKVRFVATFTPGNSKVGLESIDPLHPFYQLEGMDNIVLFYTDRYQEQPLVVKGAGAGAEVTASGIFGDILKVSLT